MRVWTVEALPLNCTRFVIAFRVLPHFRKDKLKKGGKGSPGAHGRANAAMKQATNPGKGKGKGGGKNDSLEDVFRDDLRDEFRDDDHKGGKNKKGGKKK